MKTLVWVEHDNSSMADATLAAVTAASKLGEVHLLVAGADCRAVAEQAAKIAGVGKVHVADDAAYEHGLPENVAPLIVDLMGHHDAFVAPATTTGKNIAPRVAALLDVMQISDILSVEIEDVSGPTGDGLSSFVSQEIAESERPELTSAKVIVSGGRALKDAETFEEYIMPLADKLGAGVGASRAAVDAGYVPNDYQVGQTGKIVAPEVYIAIGISGAIQHLAGMKDSKTIIAINKDEDAPIFQVADIGLVGDLYKVLPELTEKL